MEWWHMSGLLSGAIFWGAIVAIVIVGNYFSSKTRIAKYKLLETLAEKGQSLPANLTPELLEAFGREEKFRNPYQGAIVLICIGIAIAVFFWALGGGGNLFQGEGVPNWLPVLGIFPFMIGVALLIGALFNRRPPPQH